MRAKCVFAGVTSLCLSFALSRNHNFWARRLAGTGEVYTEEQLFQAARAYNRGELQNIAAYEWFPAITGRQLVRVSCVK